LDWVVAKKVLPSMTGSFVLSTLSQDNTATTQAISQPLDFRTYFNIWCEGHHLYYEEGVPPATLSDALRGEPDTTTMYRRFIRVEGSADACMLTSSGRFYHLCDNDEVAIYFIVSLYRMKRRFKQPFADTGVELLTAERMDKLDILAKQTI
jgi:hypothetical protein